MTDGMWASAKQANLRLPITLQSKLNAHSLFDVTPGTANPAAFQGVLPSTTNMYSRKEPMPGLIYCDRSLSILGSIQPDKIQIVADFIVQRSNQGYGFLIWTQDIPNMPRNWVDSFNCRSVYRTRVVKQEGKSLEESKPFQPFPSEPASIGVDYILPGVQSKFIQPCQRLLTHMELR